MQRLALAGLVALTALLIGTLVAAADFAASGTARDVQLGATDEGQIVGLFTLRTHDDGDTRDYQVIVGSDADVDLNGLTLSDVDGKQTTVTGALDGDQITADTVVVLPQAGNQNGNGNDNVDNGNANDNVDNGNGNDNSDNHGQRVSDAAHWMVAHIGPGPQRGAFMRCVAHGGDPQDCAASLGLSWDATDAPPHGHGHGHGNGHDNGQHGHGGHDD